jgi:dienelactone hydrolase
MILRPVETIEIPTSDAFPVRGHLYLPEKKPPAGVVVLCHGFKGYKTWGFFPYIASKFREAGMAALSIDFSLNGTSPARGHKSEFPAYGTEAGEPEKKPVRYPRPDLFRINTLERENTDLAHVIRAITDGCLAEYTGSALPLGLLGHSRGAVAVILNAIELDSIRAICTWSAPDILDFFTRRQKSLWRKAGSLDLVDPLDGTKLSISVKYLDDLEKNHDVYDLPQRITTLRTPHLIVHGSMDLTVRVSAAHVLYRAQSGLDNKELLVFQTGHTFGISESVDDRAIHPSRALIDATAATVRWFETCFGKGR